MSTTYEIQTEVVRQITGFVATAMGEEWTVDTSPEFANYRGAFLTGPDGARLHLRLGGRNYNDDSRLSIQGQYPRTEDGERSWSRRYQETRKDEITVSRDRDPAAIAREITRRLLPGYLEMLAEAREYVRGYDESVRNGKALRLEVAERLGGGARETHRQRVSRQYMGDRAHVEFEIPDHGQPSVEIRWITPDQARKLADFLSTF